MPTFNGASYLPAALGSVLCQGDRDIEIIAIDDGSTDDTVSILEEFSRRLRLKIIRRQHGGNWAANSNRALEVAAADHVCFLHQDDLWLRSRLRRLRELLGNNPDAVMVFHPSWFIGARGQRLGLWRCPLPVHRSLASTLFVERLLVYDFIAMPAPLFQRRAALRVGGLDPSLWFSADWDFWLKMAAEGPTVYSSRPLACFRIHRQSQTMSRSADFEDIRRQQGIVFERHFALWASRLGDNSALAAVARFARDVNASLLGSFHGRTPCCPELLRSFLGLGPAGWWRFFRDSRIIERVGARVRGGLIRSPAFFGVERGHSQGTARIGAANGRLHVEGGIL